MDVPFFTRIFILLTFASILHELIWLPVPSIASTYQLFLTKDGLTDPSNRLVKVRQWPSWMKSLLVVIPTGLSILIYALPALVALFPNLLTWLNLLFWPVPFWVMGVGVILVIIGRFITLRTTFTIRKNNSQMNDEFELKTEGMFNRMRNPGLVGLYVCFVGLWLLLPLWETAIGFFLYIGNMHFRVLLEEAFLQWKFGEPYKLYLTTTRRYL